MKVSRSTVFLIGLIVALAASRAAAQIDLRVLPDDFNADKTQQMMRAYLRREAHAAFDRRLEQLEEALNSGDIATYQQARREFLRRTFAELPRTPLKAQVTGTIEAKGFTIEKILFESQPGFFVTGNLYRPSGKGPFPAILHPCGHSANGKAASAYQLANQLLARHGFIVFCFDPIGQGERKQIFTADGEPRAAATGEHQQLGVAGILLGRSLASYMVWDGVRAIDYLCSREDVDASRIGCTGNSGGGNMTSYLMAYDDRIVAAAPGCFMTTHRRKNESPGPGDAEQNLFSQIRDGFDHPDFIIARAPKPTLILSATKDYVPIEGAWEAFRQAKRVYTQLGYPERVDLVEANANHGFSRSLREAAVRFFARWLQGRHLEASESKTETFSDAQLQVTPRGQVMQLPGARSLLDLYVEYEQELARQRRPLTPEIVREATGIRPLEKLPKPRVEVVRDDVSPHHLIFHPEPGIVLPAFYWPGGDATPVLIARDEGLVATRRHALRMHGEGHPVLAIDVRDIGETKTNNWRFPGADYYIGHMLGRNWLAMRTEDMLVCGRWLSDECGRKPVLLVSGGEIGPAALHAAALQPELIASLVVRQSLTSWQQLMNSGNAYPHLHNAVYGVLEHYDLPDLIQLRRTTSTGTILYE